MRIVYLTLLALIITMQLQGQSRKVQFIHNSADTALTELDVYLNDSLWVDDMPFRSATAFLTIPDIISGNSVRLYVCPKTSNDTSVFMYAREFPDSAGNYVAVINGVYNQSQYNPPKPIHVDFLPDARLVASDPEKTDVVIHHGSDDSPTIDVGEVSGFFPDTWVDNLSYTEFSNYQSLDSGIYRIGLLDEEGIILAISYAGYFHLPEHRGKAYTLIASGFQIPELNSFAPIFSLFAADTAGGMMEELLPAAVLDSATIQFVQAAQDLSASSLDIYLGNTLWIDNLNYKHASPFLKIPANRDYDFGICLSNSNDTIGALHHQTINFTTDIYTVVLSGLANPSGHTPPKELKLSVFTGSRVAAQENDEIDLLFFNASTDAEFIDFRSTMPVLTTLGNNVEFSKFSNNGYIDVVPYDFSLAFTDSSGNTLYNAFQFNALSNNLTGKAILVIASGFLNPGANFDGQPAGFWYVNPEGGPWIDCPKVTSINQAELSVKPKLFPNPADGYVWLETHSDTYSIQHVALLDLQGRRINTFNPSFSGNIIQLPTNQLPAGMYLVEISTSDRIFRMPLIVAH